MVAVVFGLLSRNFIWAEVMRVKVGVYDFLKKYYRRWLGDKIKRDKYHHKEIDNKNDL
mgnify:CR=1 FL=1